MAMQGARHFGLTDDQLRAMPTVYRPELFKGKAAVVTGAGSGFGFAIATLFARLGADLAILGRDEARLAKAKAFFESFGPSVYAEAFNIREHARCAAFVDNVWRELGRLDVLINNAGVTMWSRFDALSDLSVFTRLLATNYLGAVYATAAALPALKAAGGLIVAVASVAGLTGVPERSGYAASKHAMVGFFESLRIELTGSGVDVTIVAPDFVASESHRRAAGPDGRPLGISPMQESHIMSAAECARLIVGAMRRRDRLLITSARGRLGRWARLIAPTLTDRVAARAIRERR